MSNYIIDHEGPRKFVVYKYEDGNRILIEEFKTNHTAKKFVAAQGGTPIIADDKKKTRRTVADSDIPKMVEHCGPSTVSVWKQAQKSNSRKKAIRAMCLMCVGGSSKEVRLCSSVDCPLHKFRITG